MPNTHPIRFGVVAYAATSGEEWRAKAHRIEALGYSTMLMPDGLGPGFATLPALAAAAMVTESLRLGSWVLVGDRRNPLLLAQEAATVDRLSGGRFELGLGAGRPAVVEENRMLGLPVESPGVRVAHLAEQLGLLRSLLAGERVTATGSYSGLRDATLALRPVQQPHIPIAVAGSGRKMLSVAAREADIVALAVGPETPASVVDERIGWIREAAGDRFDRLELAMSLYGVLPAGGEQRRGATPWGPDPAELAAAGSPFVLTGTPEKMCRQLERQRECFGFSYIAVSEAEMEALAPVVARLSGR